MKFPQSQPSNHKANEELMTELPLCLPCEGKGYIEIRDCSGEIQREETCLFCSGTGILKDQDED
jgi:DnaJ-class molecular chaperone